MTGEAIRRVKPAALCSAVCRAEASPIHRQKGAAFAALLRCLPCLCLSLVVATPVGSAEPPRRVVGFVEKVLVGSPPRLFEGKIDTGADSSSIDATNLIQTTRSGQIWIEFTVARVDGGSAQLSGRLARYALIKRGGGIIRRRPVVMLDLCLGSVLRSVEVTLADRAGMKFDVLVGRNFLHGHFIVDPARTHILEPECIGQKK